MVLNMQIVTIVPMILIALVVSGCAANMAANGKNGPEMAVVKRQNMRADVERMLGTPVETVSNSNGELVQLYIAEAHTEPSAARAVGHAFMDVASLGFWEFVGGPMEAYIGRRQRVIVCYDEEDRVMLITDEKSFQSYSN